jgi:hypothetical protein
VLEDFKISLGVALADLQQSRTVSGDRPPEFFMQGSGFASRRRLADSNYNRRRSRFTFVTAFVTTGIQTSAAGLNRPLVL